MRRVLFVLLAALTLLVAFGLGSLISPVSSAQTQRNGEESNPWALKGGSGMTGPYDVVEGWPSWAHPYPRPGYIWGSQGGVFAEAPDRVFLASRGEIKLPPNLPRNFPGNWGALGIWNGRLAQATGQLPEFNNCIVIVDREGRLIEAWTQWDYLFEEGRGPHTVKISPYDPERAVWVISDINHQVWKFSNDGKRLLMTLGERGVFHDNDDPRGFRRPTDIAFLPEGSFFISDGYGNTRVLKFDRNGKFLKMWGTRGTAPGQFNGPHGIAVGLDRRVYVSDRGNGRIQVFDEEGNFLQEWPGIAPHTIMMAGDQHLWAFDSRTDKLVKFGLDGHLEYSWGTHGTSPGQFWAVHQVTADSEGNMYAAEVFGGRTQKFRPKSGANPTELVWGQALMPKTAPRNLTEGCTPSATCGGGGTRRATGTIPAPPNYSGTWVLDTARSEPAGGDSPETGYGSAWPKMRITQTASEITIENGEPSPAGLRLSFKLDGTESVNREYKEQRSGGPTTSWVIWDGGKPFLWTYQWYLHVRDEMTLTDGGKGLSIVRAGDTSTRRLHYTRSAS
jgi:hypothetical protein